MWFCFGFKAFAISSPWKQICIEMRWARLAGSLLSLGWVKRQVALNCVEFCKHLKMLSVGSGHHWGGPLCGSIFGGFHECGGTHRYRVPQNGCHIMANPLKWMIWGYPQFKKPLFHNLYNLALSNRTYHRQADKCEWLREGLKNVRHLVLDEAGHVANTSHPELPTVLRGWPARRVGTLQRAG